MRRRRRHNRVWCITRPKGSSRSTEGSGMIILPTILSKKWTISKRRTNLVRHRDLADRKIDQAVRRSSLCSKLRRKFQSEGARIFSDSQWLGYIHRGSNKPRFPYCVNSNNNHLYVRAIQGHSGGDLIAPELLNYVAFPLGWKQCLCHVKSSFTVIGDKMYVWTHWGWWAAQ